MKYLPELDGIRALSALLIVLYHSEVPGMSGGFFAVDIFFVLSGFLVTQLLCVHHARHGRIDWGGFMRRRVARLMPALAVMLVVYLCMAPIMWGDLVSPAKHFRDAFLTITYLVNWVNSWGGQVGVLGHVWSLAIEMQFYLLWPMAMLLLLRLERAHAIVILILLYVAMTVWRGVGSVGLDSVWDVYTRTDMHATGLMLGAVLALLPQKQMSYLAVPGFLVLSFCFTFFSTYWEPTVRYGFTLAELGAAMLILGRPSFLSRPVLGWLGQISYGIYLWHYPIVLCLRIEGFAWQQVFFYGLALTLVCASLSYYLVELKFHTPIQKRQRKL